MLRLGSTLLLFAALAGCGSGNLINTKHNQPGPDEFGILPTKPIEMPPSFSSLPPPTPGLPNRTDIDPQAEAVAALGGNPARLQPSGTSASDGALLRQTGRYGTDPNVRVALAAEDAEFRSRNRGRVLERLFNVTTYYDAYEDVELDQHRELERVRVAGVRNVGAPPEAEEDAAASLAQTEAREIEERDEGARGWWPFRR